MEKKEFLFNGDLNRFSQENGFDGWEWANNENYKMSCIKEDGKNAVKIDYVGHTHQYSLLSLTNTQEQRIALAEEIKKAGSGVYTLSCKFKAADEASVGKKIYLKMHCVFKDEQGVQIGRKDYRATDTELSFDWKDTEVDCFIFSESGAEGTKKDLAYVAVEFVVIGNEKINVVISDISLKLKKPLRKQSINNPRTIIPYDKTLVGVIRWDIWSQSHSAHENNALIAADEEANRQNGTNKYNVTSQDMMMRTLSYYPERAPYFVTYDGPQDNGDVKLSIRSCYDKTGLTYTKEDVMDDLKVKEHQYLYGVSWEEEAKMAMDAGVDYFAYLYKGINNTRFGQVLEPALAHTELNGMLPDGRQMKMVCIMQDNPAPMIDIDTLKTDEEKLDAILYGRRMIYKAMAQSCYLDVHTPKGDIPVMHFYWEEVIRITTPERLENYKKEARFYTRYLHAKNPDKYRIVDDIYCVGYYMFTGAGVKIDSYIFNYLGFDAMSKYAVSGTVTPEEREYAYKCLKESGKYDDLTKEYKDVNVEGTDLEWQHLFRVEECSHTKPSVWADAFGEDYEKYIKKIDTLNESHRDYQDVMKYIPTVSYGFNIVPRVKIRVSWCGIYGGKYVQTGTPDQLAKQLEHALDYTKKYNEDFDSAPNTLLIYAWDEFDEGGYMQPTLLVDKDGNPILDKDGNTQANDEIIVKAAKVIADFRKKESAEK